MNTKWEIVDAEDGLQDALDEFTPLSSFQRKVARWMVLHLAQLSNPTQGDADVNVIKLNRDAPGWYRAKLTHPASRSDEENAVRVIFKCCAKDEWGRSIVVSAYAARSALKRAQKAQFILLGAAPRTNRLYKIVSAVYEQMNRRNRNGR